MTVQIDIHAREVAADAPALPFAARGPLSALLCDTLTGPASAGLPDEAMRVAERALAAADDILVDDDVQLALFVLYALAYGSVPALDADWEWHSDVLRLRAAIETLFERRLRALVGPVSEAPPAERDAVARWLFDLTAPSAGPGLSRFVARRATRAQLEEFLIHRSVYTLREADPHSWAIPRLTGRAKAALVEIQADEYGGGDAGRMHSAIFARTVRAAGLDDTYGAYLDSVPAATIASHNAMSMFGLHRRLRGAIVGHLAAFEMTSSIPNRLYGDGFRRLGFDADATWYFDEHVEADAVHEQIAGSDLAGALAESEPAVLPDILFGARACLALDDLVGDQILDSWESGVSSLRQVPAGGGRAAAT